MAKTVLPVEVVSRTAPAAGCDCTVCPWYSGADRIVTGLAALCSGRNTNCSYCGCARAEGAAATTVNPCQTCSIRCGSRVDIDAWMVDVGGTLEFDDIVIPGRVPAGLPRFIPMGDGGRLADLDAQLRWPAYAVGLRRVISPRTGQLAPRWRSSVAADLLGLGGGQLSVLVGYGEDPLVETVWTRRWELIPQLVGQQWDVILAPNFSLYGNQPRTEHLINFRRNLLFAAELAAAGATCVVPNLYWFRAEDLRRYLDWIGDTWPGEGPPAVAVNVQTFRTPGEWTQTAVPGLTALAALLPADLPVILTGASRTDRVGLLVELFGERLFVVSQNPVQFARHGAVMTAGGRRDPHAHTSDLFAANVRWMARQLRTRQEA